MEKKYKLIELVLKNYKLIREIIFMETEINNLKGIRYKHAASEGNENFDSTQEAAMTKIERDNDILKINVLVNFIEKAIEILPDLEKKAIKYYYFEGYSWNEVAWEVKCSPRHSKRKRKDGINYISKLLKIDEIEIYFSIISRLCNEDLIKIS